VVDRNEGPTLAVVGVFEKIGDVENGGGGDAFSLELLRQFAIVEARGPLGQFFMDCIQMLDSSSGTSKFGSGGPIRHP